MTVNTGMIQSAASGTQSTSSTILSRAECFSVPTPMTGPLRARTSWMLLAFFSKSASSGAIKTEGVSGFTKAMTPCFNSALG